MSKANILTSDEGHSVEREDPQITGDPRGFDGLLAVSRNNDDQDWQDLDEPELSLQPRVYQAMREMYQIAKNSKGVTQFLRPGSALYNLSVSHAFQSSSAPALCAIQPGTVGDLSKIMKVLSACPNVKFAVKGGGHTTNPSFSSTDEIQISLASFNELKYHEPTGRLRMGAGCLFDGVYKALAKRNRTIVGGASTSGVGVSGWMLGGGYSLLTNQYGLGIDNLREAQVVLPNGDILTVPKQDEDLFFAIKGGGNNFGIVTSFTVQTHRQEDYRIFKYPTGSSPYVKAAVMNFIDNCTEKKAAIEGAYRNSHVLGQPKHEITVKVFYDGPQSNIPEALERFSKIHGCQPFVDLPKDDKRLRSFPYMDNLFTSIHHLQLGADLERYFKLTGEPEAKTKVLSTAEEPIPFAEKMANPPFIGVEAANVRALWGTLMVSRVNRVLLDRIEEEAQTLSQCLEMFNGKTVYIDFWPFLKSIFNESEGGAWPHEKDQPNGPLLICAHWEGEDNDKYWKNAIKKSLARLRVVAEQQDCTSDKLPVYTNTSLGDVSIESIYRENLEQLMKLRRKYDPKDVMSRTGGFRIPLWSGETN